MGSKHKKDDLEPLVLHLRLPIGDPGRMTGPIDPAPKIDLAEAAERRESVMNNRADLDLEGISPVAEITELEEQYMRGELTPNQLRDACFGVAARGVKDPSWTRKTGRLPE